MLRASASRYLDFPSSIRNISLLICVSETVSYQPSCRTLSNFGSRAGCDMDIPQTTSENQYRTQKMRDRGMLFCRNTREQANDSRRDCGGIVRQATRLRHPMLPLPYSALNMGSNTFVHRRGMYEGTGGADGPNTLNTAHTCRSRLEAEILHVSFNRRRYIQ
jgi:hypothetical protein